VGSFIRLSPAVPLSLVFLHQYFFPELAGSAQQLTDLALGLKERGYSIRVVTGQPSYSLKGKLPNRENFKGIQIYRVPKLQLSREGSLGRILSSVSFFLMAFLKVFWMNPQALLVIGSDPPFLPLLGWFFRKVRGQRYILVVSDIYPDIAVALGELRRKSWIVRVLELSNRMGYPSAEKIVVLGEKMAECLQAKFPKGQGREKIQVIPNWANGNWIRPLAKSENRFCVKHKLLDRFVVLFSGNLGKIYNFEDVLDAASSLAGNSSVEFLFIGDGPVRKVLEKEAAARGSTHIRFLPYQPADELPYSLSCGDLALIPLKKEAAGLCVPGKLYYALAAGLPLLVIAPEDSEPARIVRENDCGWSIPPGNAESVVNLLRELSKEPSLLAEKRRRSRACFEAFFTRQRAILQYESVFSSL